MAAQRFTATFEMANQSAGLVELPFDPRAVFGKARAPVRGTINGVPFRTTVAVYDGRSVLGFRGELREAAGAQDGSMVKIVVEPDSAERTVEVPEELARALAKNRAAQAAWDQLSYSHRREHAEAIGSAKKPETRARRVEKAIAMLVEKGASSRAKR